MKSETEIKNSKKKSGLFVASGTIVTLFWIFLLLTGMLVNSSYYRAAISFDYAGLDDWLWALFSFTLSNVAILAFLAGFLGGIISKMKSTEGFTVSEEELKEKGKNKYLYENPFISAV